MKFCVVMALTLYSAASQADNFQAFTVESIDHIKQVHKGQPFMVNLWSVSCLPCRLELEMLGELKARQPDFPLVLISTDPIETREEALYVLEEYGLDSIDSWMFADAFVERLRHAIDPTWYGELPRSYLYRADHSFEAHSGVLTEKVLEAFAAALD